jgi:hypothetical protein
MASARGLLNFGGAAAGLGSGGTGGLGNVTGNPLFRHAAAAAQAGSDPRDTSFPGVSDAMSLLARAMQQQQHQQQRGGGDASLGSQDSGDQYQ